MCAVGGVVLCEAVVLMCMCVFVCGCEVCCVPVLCPLKMLLIVLLCCPFCSAMPAVYVGSASGSCCL